MAATIDLEKIVGTDDFPNNENDVLGLIETIASQRIMALRSANRLIDATFDYDVENGRVIQEAVIEMAKSYAYDKNAYDRAPEDPTLHVRYFSDYTERQFQTTIRRDDIRKIIANKGKGVEDVIAQILSTLTSGEGHEDFENVRALLLNEYVKDYSSILGGVPKNIKGCIYAARNMYNHLKSDNSDLTQGAGTADAYVSSTPEEDIRVAITESLLNLMDVVELANIFNLQKEELFGVLVVVPDSDLPAAQKYKIVAYDRKAMGRATFTYDFTQEYVPKGRYQNEYLTVSRCYFFNELFKAAALDCTVAAEAALGDIIQSPFDITVNVTDGTSQGDATILLGGQAQLTLAADEGYNLPETITVAGASYTYDQTTGVVVLSNPTGAVTVTAVCVAQGGGDLTPFAVGQTISGIEIDPSGMSVSELNSYLANLPTPPAQGSENEGSDYLVTIGGSIDEETGKPLNPDIKIGYADRVTTGEPSWGVNVLLVDSGADLLYYAPQQINLEEEGEIVVTIPQGWSRMNSETGTFDVFTEEVTLSFASNTVMFVSPNFAPFNGVVIGAVVSE